MRNDERLRTIYEVMAPYIVRNEHNWRDYLAFASQFHKHSFDNILLVYAQDEDVSILATRKQWAAIGRNLIPRAKGVAVCVYRNAKLTLDYLFDVSQTIIYDCGVMQTPTSIFRDADHRLLCGSVLPYEIPVFHKALSECGSLEVRPVAICVPQEIQEYCMELFGENVQIAAASHDLFAKRVNGQIYRPLVEKYIAGEKRL